MKAIITATAVAAVTLWGAASGAAGQTPAQELALTLGTATAEPAPGTSATIAAGDETIVAWLQRGGDTQRVAATAGRSESIAILGPSGPGFDGAPVAAAANDGTVWVLASRNDGNTQRLWTQRWANGWQAPSPGPIARDFDHHPALAVDPASSQMWVAWIGENGLDRNSAMLFASRWDGRAWGPAEPLPRTAGAPMAPSIAVDATGTPVVVWAASDGNDAEIWISRRSGGRWSTPLALSRNQVPDIHPSVASVGTELLVAWISYTDEGYLPIARVNFGADAWDDAVALSDTPGGRPYATSAAGRPAVFWRRLENGPTAGTIVASTLDSGAWRQPVEIAAASGSPFAVAGAADGRLMLAFTRPDGRLGVVGGARTVSRSPLQELAAVSSALYGPARSVAPDPAIPAPAADIDPLAPFVPESYTAFGDSITNGVLYDPDRSESLGYRGPLEGMLRATFGLGTVFNAGVDGEETADGVGRIDNAIGAQDPRVILIMEGTNDVMSAIDIEVIAFNLRRMVQRSYEERPDIIPLLAQLPPRLDPGPDGFDGPGNGRIDELNAMLSGIGEEEGATVVDQNTPIDGHPELMSNHLHPSAAGYQVMGEVWFDAVRPEVMALTNRGDVDASGRTDGLDLVRLALTFGAIAGEERYDPAADINGDGIIDGFDLAILVEFFGQDIAEGQEPPS